MVLFLAFLGVLFCRRSWASRQTKWVAILSYTLGVTLLPIHWTLLLAGPIAWLSAAERTCLVMLVLSALYAAWLFSWSDGIERLASSALSNSHSGMRAPE